jgi:hypothetical protein
LGTWSHRKTHTSDRQAFEWGLIEEVCEVSATPTRVYNLEVSEDHSYVAGGFVVHNCDVLASADLHGFGEGLYHPSTVPALPHPWCECRIEVTIKRPSQRPTGSEEREVPDRPEDVPVQAIMEETDGERAVTEAHVKAQREMIDRALRIGHENER